jgi:DNA-binding NarL/FixJ family response regulator
MVKIIIADDHPIVRAGLKDVLAEDLSMDVIDEAGDGRELIRKINQREPDLIILDISMPGVDGLAVLKQIKTERPQIKILILTIHPEVRYALRCLQMGADGYLNKSSAPGELIGAINRIVAGRKYISPTVAEEMLNVLESSSERPPHEALSDREYQVMLMIASGKGLKEIADDLALSVKTVSTYRTRILEKMNLKNNSELILYAIRNDLIE